jgi:hypothetical protein
MQGLREFVSYNVERLSGPEWEQAYHSLIEAEPAVIPLLIEAFRKAVSSGLRATIVEVVWQFRRPETIEFLAAAFQESDPPIWQQALDGSVTIGGAEALRVMQKVREQLDSIDSLSAQKLQWIDEAIGQLKEKETV